MSLSAADKRYLRKMVKEEIDRAIHDFVEGQHTTQGGYDGATPVTDDDWAEDGRRRVGFVSPTAGRP